MRLLLDQDVYVVTARFLRVQNHDVVTAAEVNLSQSADTDLLDYAREHKRILITRDRDFGGFVFVHSFGSGVIYLRMMPSTLDAVHHELGRVLMIYTLEQLAGAFVVVEPGRHRFRRLPGR
jgi:predicted nuclease of predicted toxin-antitoxin system